MSNVSHEFVSVDMRGMKAALVALAHARRCGVSTIVRTAVARELGLERPDLPLAAAAACAPEVVKISIRLSSAEAAQLAAGVRDAGLSRGAYIGGLVSGAAVLSRRKDHLAALTASCAELAILSRNIYHLTTLLRQGSTRAAQAYVEMLDSLKVEVRRHLKVAADARLTCARATPVQLIRSEPTKGRSDTPGPRDIDGVLVQWGDRLFYPGNRIVKPASEPRLSGFGRSRVAFIREQIAATVVRLR